MVDAHEPVRPKRSARTSRTGLRVKLERNEFNAWVQAFILLSPTINTSTFYSLRVGDGLTRREFSRSNLDYYQPGKKEQVHTTLAKTVSSIRHHVQPFAMGGRLPESYERFMDAFPVYKDVAVDGTIRRFSKPNPRLSDDRP